MFEIEDSIIVRANFTTRGEEDLISTVCASQLMAESIGEGRFDRCIDGCVDAISRGRMVGGGGVRAEEAMRLQYLLTNASMVRPRKSAKACGRRSRCSPFGRRPRVSAQVGWA
mgnify:CR=1 FL=1